MTSAAASPPSTTRAGLSWSRLELTIDGVPLDLAVASRAGEGAPVLFLHGFGGTKEDYADVALHPAFDGRTVIAYDAPGCGQTTCGDLSVISIPSWSPRPAPCSPSWEWTGSISSGTRWGA